DPGGGRAGPRLAPRYDGDPRAPARQGLRRGQPDSVGRAGDDHLLARDARPVSHSPASSCRFGTRNRMIGGPELPSAAPSRTLPERSGRPLCTTVFSEWTSPMAVAAFSPEWPQAFKDEINRSPVYRDAAKGWKWTVGLVVEAEPDRNFPDARGVVMDLFEGQARDVRLGTPADA